MQITSKTKLRRFGFTLYEHADISFVSSIEGIYSGDKNPFQYIVFQHELNHDTQDPDGRVHMQGFCMLNKRLLVGTYSSSKKSGIKELFDANVHLDLVNGTPEQCRDYCIKKYNRCKVHKKCDKKCVKPCRIHKIDKGECRCSYFDLNERCDTCDESCVRTLARVCDVNDDDTPSGPWEFGCINNKSNNVQGSNQHKKESSSEKVAEKKLRELKYMKKMIREVIKGGDIDEILVKYAPKISARVNIGYDRIKKAIDNVKNKPIARCWKPCNIYIFGNPRTGKSFWGDIVFPNAYKKSVEDDWKWWSGYSNKKRVVIVNEVYKGTIPWSNFLNILDRQPINVQIKHSTEVYGGMIQVFTSNLNLRKMYDYAEDHPYIERGNGFRVANGKFFSAILGRFDYVIEYRKFRSDNTDVCANECSCCEVRRIFWKGSKEKFQGLEFDIEFNSDVTQDQALELVDGWDEGGLYKIGSRLVWKEKYEDRGRYVITDSENVDGMPSDLIVYPEIMEKFRDRGMESVELIKSVRKRIHDSDDVSSERSKRMRFNNLDDDIISIEGDLDSERLNNLGDSISIENDLDCERLDNLDNNSIGVENDLDGERFYQGDDYILEYLNDDDQSISEEDSSIV